MLQESGLSSPKVRLKQIKGLFGNFSEQIRLQIRTTYGRTRDSVEVVKSYNVEAAKIGRLFILYF